MLHLYVLVFGASRQDWGKSSKCWVPSSSGGLRESPGASSKISALHLIVMKAHFAASLSYTEFLVSSRLLPTSGVVADHNCRTANLILALVFQPILLLNLVTRLFESMTFVPLSPLTLCSTPLAVEKYKYAALARALSRQNTFLKSPGRQTQISSKALFPLVAQWCRWKLFWFH